jgi:hypothetical protein
MRIGPRPPADPAGPAGPTGPGDARARVDALWALALRRFYAHVHDDGDSRPTSEDDDDRS